MTQQINLEKYSAVELKQLIKNAEKELANKSSSLRKEAKARIISMLNQEGLTLEDIMGGAGRGRKKGSGTPVAPKYCNPNDASQTWTGRGKEPIWFRDAVAAGKTKESMKIK